jgi:hypothetical protein
MKSFEPCPIAGHWIAWLWRVLFPTPTPPARTNQLWIRPEPPVPTPPSGSFLIGTVRETKERVYALGPQLDRHLLIIGGTGCGKTTLISRLYTEEILKWQ